MSAESTKSTARYTVLLGALVVQLILGTLYGYSIFWRPLESAIFPTVMVVEQAQANARQALARRLAEQASQTRLLEGLRQRFDLDDVPGRIEVYDNSHLQGAHAVGAFVVAGPEGFDKRSYRTFTIKETRKTDQGGDDFAMMREVM